MYYCLTCEREFVNELAIDQHFENSSIHKFTYCARCSRHFANPHAKDQHIQFSYSHWICAKCNIDFASIDDLRDHKVASDRHHYCQTCNQEWGSYRLYRSHIEYSPRHFWCGKCEREFATNHDLTQHSKKHRIRYFSCAGGCGLRFASPSAIMIHWEMAACRPDRQELYEHINHVDERNMFTIPKARNFLTQKKRRCREAFDEHYNSEADSWDCPYCDRRYNCQRQLTMHLKSPHHDPLVFMCPNNDCGYQSPVLSGLYQHIENSACSEAARCLHSIWNALSRATVIPH